jgi:hypothetical protein
LNPQETIAQNTDNKSEMSELAKNGSFRVKILLTFNPKIPTEILEELSQDENQEVQGAAKDALTRRGQKIKAQPASFFLNKY